MRASVSLDDGTTWSGELTKDIKPDPEPLAGSIGYFGCFPIHGIARGAHILDPDTPLWEPYYGTPLSEPYYDGTPPAYSDGGWVRGFTRYNASLGRWTDPGFIGWFDLGTQLANHTDTVALWGVPSFTDDDWRNNPDPWEKLDNWLDRVRDWWVGPLFVSLMPKYGAHGPPCKSIKDIYTEACRPWYEYRIWLSDFRRGPVLPTPLTEDKLQPEGWPQPGRCNLNERGILTLAAPVVAFDWAP